MNKYTDPWNRTESSEVGPFIQENVTFGGSGITDYLENDYFVKSTGTNHYLYGKYVIKSLPQAVYKIQFQPQLGLKCEKQNFKMFRQ